MCSHGNSKIFGLPQLKLPQPSNFFCSQTISRFVGLWQGNSALVKHFLVYSFWCFKKKIRIRTYRRLFRIHKSAPKCMRRHQPHQSKIERRINNTHSLPYRKELNSTDYTKKKLEEMKKAQLDWSKLFANRSFVCLQFVECLKIAMEFSVQIWLTAIRIIKSQRGNQCTSMTSPAMPQTPSICPTAMVCRR